MKTYAMMLSTTDDLFQEEIWTSISRKVENTEDRIFFFCGKPLASDMNNEMKHNIIFNLLDGLPLDGLIVLTGSLSLYIGIEGFRNYLNKFDNIPIVSLFVDLPNCINLSYSNYNSSYLLTEHLIQHNFKSYSCIKGHQNSKEANDRFDGAKDALKKHGKAFDYIYQGNYSERSGYLGALEIIEKSQSDVIICGNDEMAFGAFKAIEESGLKIPDDISLVGYDDVERATLHKIGLTTVRQPFSEISRLSIDALKGVEFTQEHIQAQLKIRSSCRCENVNCNQLASENQLIKRKYSHVIDSYEDMIFLSASFNGVNDLSALNKAIKSYLDKIKGTEFYLCLYDEAKLEIGDPSLFTYPEKMICQLAYIYGEVLPTQEYLTFQGLPDDCFKRTKTNSHLVYPIIMDDKSYGHIIVDSKMARKLSFVAFRSIIGNVLNRIDINNQLLGYSKQLEMLALKDSLTGVFNRRGLFSIAEENYKNGIKLGRQPGIVYCDINGLKQVNDTYGHASGDFLIAKIAEILETYFIDGVVSRVGGDEFVIYLDDCRERDTMTIRAGLYQRIQMENEKKRVPYEISTGIGISIYDSDRNLTLSELIDAADKNLYKNKYGIL